tara:strand:- start:1206 stop:1412 length:207 start_codon:yes stop_codon:yes gene_type:complete
LAKIRNAYLQKHLPYYSAGLKKPIKLMIYFIVTDCFGKWVVPKNRSSHLIDFDVLQIILDLGKKYKIN